jgi:hypothetical protein
MLLKMGGGKELIKLIFKFKINKYWRVTTLVFLIKNYFILFYALISNLSKPTTSYNF